MRAGKLDRTIQIERKSSFPPDVSPTGAATVQWITVATVRAETVQLSAAEYLTGFGEAERGTIIFRIRFVAELTTADRVLYELQPFKIVEIKETMRRRELELRCERTRS